ncbi:EamA family transporter [Bradymonas sediminis]|uniref:Uncharacterized protein n=1 Tax=Bradymonas sediminis TaxID=1548548 RepID=A0A2Z4FQL7_9DELT|nr:EamA family transporter [Bradymonas sediminis]AWV90946.1 hypothetical protein DN745_17085 [Bradymonas sediminis]TDP75317.1 putative membrane protein [Bradymonas sediminis]
MTDLLEFGFILALLSALSWASVDIIRKYIVANLNPTSALVGLMLGQVLLLLPFVLMTEVGAAPSSDHTLVKTLFIGIPDLSKSYLIQSAGSIALNLAANLLFLRAVAISPLSLTTPYLALTPVFSALVAFLWLGQIVTGWGIVGILIVCVGAFFLNPGSKSDGLLAPIKAIASERGSLYMICVSLCWSITPILDSKASLQTSPLWHTAFLALGMGVSLAIYLIARGEARTLIADLKILPAVGVCASFLLLAAMTLQLSAYGEGVPIAYVETIKRAGGVTTAMLAGYLFFGEKDIARRFIGAAVMVIGVAMVLFSGG